MTGHTDPDGQGVGHRACQRCGAGLRRGHPGRLCDPCSRHPDLAERLREAEFFTREPIRKALAAYDFGYLFRAIRRTLELTQHQLGAVLGLDQDRISRIERGERPLRDIATIARIATRLAIPPATARLRPNAAPTESAQAAESEEMEWGRRQDFSRTAAGTTTPADSSLLTPGHPSTAVTVRDHTDPGRAAQRVEGDTVAIWGRRRIVRCDARGLPVREEVTVAAEESAQFRRWSAATNVDDDVLDQMASDIAELARREQIDPPATVFSSVLGARDDVFTLLAGRQQPRHTTDLYKIAGQLCGLLSIITFDLGHPHAANTHARTALHCAEVSGHTPLRAFVRYVQSNIAYWAGRYDEAAALVESGLPDATSGTALLRLTSQQARIHAARHQPGELSQALALAATASTDRTPDEPGTFGFDAGTVALCASDAHGAFDETEHLNAAVDWAYIAMNEFTTETLPKAMYIAAARFNLARAHLARDELDAVGEHLAPVLRSTRAEYRTVPIIGRAHALRNLLDQRTDLASSTLATLSDDLAEFVAHPAPTPPGLEPGTAT